MPHWVQSSLLLPQGYTFFFFFWYKYWRYTMLKTNKHSNNKQLYWNALTVYFDQTVICERILWIVCERIQGEKLANVLACCCYQLECEFIICNMPEACVDNNIVTTKMAEDYLLVYKNSSKKCAPAFFEVSLPNPLWGRRGSILSIYDRLFAIKLKFPQSTSHFLKHL